MTEEELGKPVASDLREGKTTLPVIHALAHGSGEEQLALRQVLDDGGFLRTTPEEIQQILRRNGSVDYALAAAARYAEQARNALSILDDSEYKRALMSLPDLVVERNR